MTWATALEILSNILTMVLIIWVRVRQYLHHEGVNERLLWVEKAVVDMEKELKRGEDARRAICDMVSANTPQEAEGLNTLKMDSHIE